MASACFLLVICLILAALEGGIIFMCCRNNGPSEDGAVSIGLSMIITLVLEFIICYQIVERLDAM